MDLPPVEFGKEVFGKRGGGGGGDCDLANEWDVGFETKRRGREGIKRERQREMEI